MKFVYIILGCLILLYFRGELPETKYKAPIGTGGIKVPR